MRLIKLKVRNIASLKGEHEIDFQDIQRQSPLFAITGETGSGKSSLLNSISLALYGQIYKKNVNQIDVVTLGEKDGQIELIFQVKGKNYLADWRARVLKQNGEPYATPQTPARNLYTLEGNEFSSPKNIATVSAAELLNLDFDQFTKCIILNQGEFAKFLTSSFTDRKEILEKLYPGEMLESMGRELKLELDSLQRSKEALEIELQTLKGDGVSGDVLKEEKLSLESQLQSLINLSELIDKIDYHFVSLSSNHEKHSENVRKIQNIKKDLSEETTRYNLLLKKGQEVLEKKDEAQRELDQKLPGLQILLKNEETLKNARVQQEEMEQKLKELMLLVQKIKKNLEDISQKESAAKKKLEDIQRKLTLPLDSLKIHRSSFDETFDLYSQIELLNEEIKGKRDRLTGLETQGIELKKELEEVKVKLIQSPEEMKREEKELEKEKQIISLKIETRQRSEIKHQEIQKVLEDLKKENEESQRRHTTLSDLIAKTQVELSPIETTLKLQEVMSAAETCLIHALEGKVEECPVCKQGVTLNQWEALKEHLGQNNLSLLKKRSSELSLLLVQSTEEEKLLLLKLKALSESQAAKEKELEEALILLKEKTPSLEEIDIKLSELKKRIWEMESFQKEVTKITHELAKAREQYAQLKSDLSQKDEQKSKLQTRLDGLIHKMEALIPVLDGENILKLKKESRLLTHYLESEALLNKIEQDKTHQSELVKERGQEHTEISHKKIALDREVLALQQELEQELQGKKASELIHELNLKLKQTADAWSVQEQAQKKEELQLKEYQSRMYELDKLTKDYDLQFTRERHTIRELAQHKVDNERTATSELMNHLKSIALELDSERELFIPLTDYIKSEKTFYKEKLNETRMKFASVKARLEDWEKLQDKILITVMKTKDITEKFERKNRLYEVLGKDELRTFVLSLVEENLIEQTNQELQKLCQGRYEILHQSRKMKMTPEFFILDKFREGGLRKLSTLSGGETFMVSLAMALGLAEMTRGQAEIDSLFIDEGFGTLDQDSLEDVLDMLQQIQNRGLMVGIISHIKALTNSIPVNLVLSKKQDGTSNISVRLN